MGRYSGMVLMGKLDVLLSEITDKNRHPSYWGDDECLIKLLSFSVDDQQANRLMSSTKFKARLNKKRSQR